MSHFVDGGLGVPVRDVDVAILIKAVPFSIIVIKKLSLVKISERKNY